MCRGGCAGSPAGTGSRTCPILCTGTGKRCLKNLGHPGARIAAIGRSHAAASRVMLRMRTARQSDRAHHSAPIIHTFTPPGKRLGVFVFPMASGIWGNRAPTAGTWLICPPQSVFPLLPDLPARCRSGDLVRFLVVFQPFRWPWPCLWLWPLALALPLAFGFCVFDLWPFGLFGFGFWDFGFRFAGRPARRFGWLDARRVAGGGGVLAAGRRRSEGSIHSFSIRRLSEL